MFYGKINYLLQSVNVRCKSCHYYSASDVIYEKSVQSFADDAFAHRVAFLFYVSRFAKQQSYAFFAYFRNSRNIYHRAVNRR